MKTVKVSECLKKRKAFVKFIYLNKIRKKNQDEKNKFKYDKKMKK